VPFRNHLRASSVRPMSAASSAADWYRYGFGCDCVLRMPCARPPKPLHSFQCGAGQGGTSHSWRRGIRTALLHRGTQHKLARTTSCVLRLHTVISIAPPSLEARRTFSHRSRARMRLPCRFSSSPQPCQAAACSGLATVAASYSLRATLALPSLASRYAHAAQIYGFTLSAAGGPEASGSSCRHANGADTMPTAGVSQDRGKGVPYAPLCTRHRHSAAHWLGMSSFRGAPVSRVPSSYSCRASWYRRCSTRMRPRTT